jgi:hypothetical protein
VLQNSLPGWEPAAKSVDGPAVGDHRRGGLSPITQVMTAARNLQGSRHGKCQ